MSVNAARDNNHLIPGPLTYEEWIYLNAGDEVVVQRLGRPPWPGHIDEINEDATIFWVGLHNSRGRIMVYEGDGSVVMRADHSLSD